MSSSIKSPDHPYLTNFDSGHGALWHKGSTGPSLIATYWHNELDGTYTFAGAEPHLRQVRGFDILEACKNYLVALGKEPRIELISD